MDITETLKSMGFPEKSVIKAIEVTENKGVEEAMEWLLAHADDPAMAEAPPQAASAQSAATLVLNSDTSAKPTDVEQSTEEKMETEEKQEESTKDETAEDAEAKSIKCDECGKLFKSSEEVEFHAVKSGHSSFSESTEEKAPLTEEQKKQKLLEIEEKLKERRRLKLEEEKKEQLEKEKKRIEVGKSMAEIKRKMEEDEMKKIAAERRREKMEDKLARERVKAQIEADKEARRMKLAEARGETVPAPAPTPKPVATSSAPKKSYDETRIQFRLPTGPPVVQNFKSMEPLSAVMAWVSVNHPSPEPTQSITLSTTFPRKVFTEEEMGMPLQILGLVPSSVLMVQYK